MSAVYLESQSSISIDRHFSDCNEIAMPVLVDSLSVTFSLIAIGKT